MVEMRLVSLVSIIGPNPWDTFADREWRIVSNWLLHSHDVFDTRQIYAQFIYTWLWTQKYVHYIYIDYIGIKKYHCTDIAADMWQKTRESP